MPHRSIAWAVAGLTVLLLTGCSTGGGATPRAAGPGPAVTRTAPTSEPVTSPTATAEAPPPHSLRVAAAGDFGSGDRTDAVLRRIGAGGYDLALALGDLSYGDPGEEDEWCARVTRHVGEGLPFQLVAGNHESDGRDGSIDQFAACLPNRLPGLVGTYGREWYADVPLADPLVRIVMISPDLRFPDGVADHAAGTAHHEWTAEAVRGARSAGIPWVVVGFHKPCLSVGRYGCDNRSDVFELLLAEGVDLVLHGHEHHYSRTHQLALGAGCPSVPVDEVDGNCVRDRDGTMRQGDGTVFVTVGTGGADLREAHLEDPEWNYFAAVSAANLDPSHGFLEVEVTAGELRGRFVPAGSGRFSDAFTIRR